MVTQRKKKQTSIHPLIHAKTIPIAKIARTFTVNRGNFCTNIMVVNSSVRNSRLYYSYFASYCDSFTLLGSNVPLGQRSRECFPPVNVMINMSSCWSHCSTPCLSFLSFHPFKKKQQACCQGTSCIFTNKYTIAHIRNTKVQSTVRAHINKHTQMFLWGVPKSFRSGKSDTETQETIGCQRGPWARFSHISPSWSVRYRAVAGSAELQATETTLHLLPLLPLLTSKWPGITLPLDRRDSVHHCWGLFSAILATKDNYSIMCDDMLFLIEPYK